jgi:SpoVK/Ycf46/Vps4 family AAA+-type ATPase
MADIWGEIELRIRARYPYLYLVTHEEGRVAAHVKQLAATLNLPLRSYTSFKGFEPGLNVAHADQDALPALAEDGASGIILLPDFHLALADQAVSRQLKDLRDRFAKQRQTLVVTAPVITIPQELSKHFAVLDIPLPSVRELALLFGGLCKAHKTSVGPDLIELFARSATGLTAEEATLIFSRVLLSPEMIEQGDTSAVVAEKRRLVESEGVLEYYDRSVGLADVGGLYALKDWLAEREAAFAQSARDYGLPAPKGMLLLGVQGCGKSLTAKAVAAHFKLPLVRMDLTAAFGSARSPEEAIRHSLKLLEAMAPVVVWIDEIEKGFAGSKGGGELSVNRIFGHFITWLQEKRAPVFVAATANRVQDLPPELLRKGRFDELFFVDLPDEREREEIIRVHLNRRKLDPASFDVAQLAQATRNYTGAELEQIITDALYRAFARKRTVNDADLIETAQKLIPIYNTYEEEIKILRDWCNERTRKASTDSSMADYFQRET